MSFLAMRSGRNFILPLAACLLAACGGDEGGIGSISLSATAVSETEISLSWSEPSGDISYSPYVIARADDNSSARVGSTASRSFLVAGLSPGTRYCFEIRAPFTGIRVSNVACTTTRGTPTSGPGPTPPTDTEAPSAPQQVAANYSSEGGAETIAVTWSPSSDDTGIAGYTVFRDGIMLAETTNTGFTDTSLQTNVTYCYSVMATDIVGKTSGLSQASCTRTGWNRRTLGVLGVVNAAIGIDANDVPHAAYKSRGFNIDLGMDQLMLGFGAVGDTFAPVTLDDSIVEGQTPDEFPLDMVIDPNGIAHILHQPAPGPSSGNLEYVIRSASQTDRQDVPGLDSPLSNVSLAIDGSGELHACLQSTGTLYYGNTGSGVWILTPIGSLVAGAAGRYCSIAVDANNTVHIAYLEASTNDLWYASNASGGWSSERVDQQSGTSTNSTYHTAIAIDSAGFAHIAYAHDFADNDMEYATNASGAWTSEKVDDSGTVGPASGIVIDSTDKVYVLYKEQADTRSLRLASRESGAWTSFVLSSSGFVPGLSVSVDSSDKLHVVFSNENRELTYITNRP